MFAHTCYHFCNRLVQVSQTKNREIKTVKVKEFDMFQKIGIIDFNYKGISNDTFNEIIRS